MKRMEAKVFSQAGTWKVIHDDQKEINPYRVTLNGRKRIDYADMTSCLLYLAQNVPQAGASGTTLRADGVKESHRIKVY